MSQSRSSIYPPEQQAPLRRLPESGSTGKRFDLHRQPRNSDGRAAPAQVVQSAAQVGLVGTAVRDHDNEHEFNRIYEQRLKFAAREHFLQLIDRHRLQASGGSDDHGWPQGFQRLGKQPITESIAAALRARRPTRGGPYKAAQPE